MILNFIIGSISCKERFWRSSFSNFCAFFFAQVKHRDWKIFMRLPELRCFNSCCGGTYEILTAFANAVLTMQFFLYRNFTQEIFINLKAVWNILMNDMTYINGSWCTIIRNLYFITAILIAIPFFLLKSYRMHLVALQIRVALLSSSEWLLFHFLLHHKHFSPPL